MKVLDTDTCIEAIRGRSAVLDRIDSESESLAVTVVTHAELFYGASKSAMREREFAQVDRFLSRFALLPLESPAARAFGETKAALEREGQRLADADLFIAAICLQHEATLVTGNRRHFDRIPALTLEDWINPA